MLHDISGVYWREMRADDTARISQPIVRLLGSNVSEWSIATEGRVLSGLNTESERVLAPWPWQGLYYPE